MSKARVSLKVTLLTPLIISGVVCLLSFLGALDFIDGRAYDIELGLRTEPEQKENIIFIDVDDKAIDYAGTWPIRRDYVADSVVLMAEMGLSYIVFDIEYVDLSPSTVDESLLEDILPEKSSSLLSETERDVIALFNAVEKGSVDLAQMSYYLPDLKDSFQNINIELQKIYSDLSRNSDEYLGQAASVFGNAYFTINLVPGVMLDIDPALLGYYSDNISISNVGGRTDLVPEATAVMPTIEPVIIGAAGAGFPNVLIDSDGVRRRVYLIQKYKNDIYGQLAFRPVLDLMGNPDIEVMKDSIVLSGIQSQNEELPDTMVIPLAEDGSMLINWPHADYLDSFTHISFGLLLEHNKLLNAVFRNIQIREEWGYLDSFRARETPANSALRLAETRRAAVYSSNKAMLNDYSDEVDLFLQNLSDFLTPEYTESFLDNLNKAYNDGSISEENYSFINNDFSIWVNAVKKQISDLKTTRTYLREELNNKFAVIGNAATGTTDIGINPFSEKYINIGTHAAVANTILNNDFIDDRPWYWPAIASILMSFGLAYLIRSTGPLLSGGISLGLAGAGAAISVILMTQTGIFISPVNLLISNIVIYAAYTVIKFRAAEAEKGFIKDAFSHYLSEDVISEVLNDPDKLALGGEMRYLTAMFTDVQGFSTISEQMDPQGLVQLLNRYLGEMSDVVLDEKGTIDKYEGDAIIAFFGAPLKVDDHAERACHSAVLMKRIEIKLNKEFLDVDSVPGPLLTRIGINSGDIVVGNMGTERKMNYTMMGNAVNLAARLEGVNKQYGTWILTSEETHSHIGNGFLTRKLDRVRVVGINTPVRLIEIVEFKKDADSESKELVEMFEIGLGHYENRDFVNSHKYFTDCLKINEFDRPSKIYLDRSQGFLEKEPEEDWDAVINLTSK